MRMIHWQGSTVLGFFDGRVLVLTGPSTGSAAEDFTMPFKDNGCGVIVGEQTCGSTGQPEQWEYAGINVGIGAIRAYMPDGTPFASPLERV